MKKLKIKGFNQKDTENKYKNYYIENYVRNSSGEKIILKTSDGFDVLFYDNADTHAYTIKQLNSRIFNFGRARILNWIKIVICGSCPEKIYKFDSYKYREYFLEKEKYLIILRWRRNRKQLVFVTHYVINNYFKLLKVKRRFDIIP